jgi:hypothetical protein
MTSLANRYGPQAFTLTVIGMAGERQLPPLVGQVHVDVDSPLSAYPSSVDAAGLEPNLAIDRRIVLADNLASNEVEPKVVRVSDSSVISVRVEPTREVLRKGERYTLQGRFAIQLTIRPGDRPGMHRETVAIDLDDGRTIEIPVTWRVLLPIEATPTELVVSRRTSESRARRTVFLRVRKPPLEELRVDEVPVGVEAAFDLSGSGDAKLSVTLPDRIPEETTGDQIVVVGLKTGRRVIIPIRYLP